MYQIQLINHVVLCERRLEIETDQKNHPNLKFFQDRQLDFSPSRGFTKNLLRILLRQIVSKRPYCSYTQKCYYKTLEE